MKTFLKALLLALILIVAIKLSPVIFAGALLVVFVAGIAGAIGLSLAVVLLGVTFALLVALAPIWLPVLAIMGLVSLCRRSDRKPTPAAG